MNFATSMLALVLLLLLPATAGAQTTGSTAAPAEKGAERAEGAEIVESAEAVRSQVDQSVAMARDGVYGPLNRGEMARVEAAQERLHALLEGHDDLGALSPEDSLAVQQARDTVRTTLHKEGGDRMVCRRGARTGSRLGSTECLSVAQREARAAAAREGVDKVQRNVCYPGEGQSCL